MPVKTTKAGSIKALRASVERKGGGNEAFLQRVPADDSITVRFLTEPEDWQSYFEHYDQVMRYYPCSDNCPGCTEGDRPAQRYLANAFDVENNRVIPMVIPKTLVTKLLNSYDRYGTMVDRDYELIRLGSGLDTDYDRSPEVPTKRPTKGLTLLDLEAVLENQLSRAFDPQGEEAAKTPEKTKPKAEKPKAEPEPEEEEESTGGESISREDLEEMSLRELRVYAKSEAKIPPADIRGLDQEALVELILDRADTPTATPDEEDDDDSDDGDVDQEDTPTEEVSGGDDSDETELTEEDIRKMTLPELRKLCGELEIPWKRTDGKATLTKKILESIPDDDTEDEPPF